MSPSKKKTAKSDWIGPHPYSGPASLGHFAEAWATIEHYPGEPVLKLAVLRSMVRLIHSFKSELDPTKRTDDALELLRAEAHIEGARNQNLDHAPYGQLVNQGIGGETVRRKIPFELIQKFSKTSFDRFDRNWEFTLLAEAIEQNWSLYTLDMTISLKEAEKVHTTLEISLWPHAVVLFVEPSRIDVEPGFWRGRWFIVCAPLHSLQALVPFSEDKYQTQVAFAFSLEPEPSQP